jgi:hypothetical protein
MMTNDDVEFLIDSTDSFDFLVMTNDDVEFLTDSTRLIRLDCTAGPKNPKVVVGLVLKRRSDRFGTKIAK